MTELSASIKLRPVRVALLASPTDTQAITQFMRISNCMWGGQYNPIIPVFRKPPKIWSAEFPGDVTGIDIARGYIRFFEPDVFVEARPGLLEAAGLASLRGSFRDRTFTLDKVLAPDPHKDWAELHLGLSIIEAIQDIYKNDKRFQPRDPSAAIAVKNPPKNGMAEAMFGVYPSDDHSSYFAENYRDVFQPEIISCGPTLWKRVFLEGATTPLRTTSHGIQPQRTWSNDLKLFVFDPKHTTDLVDLWNLRSEANPVLPVPIGWFSDLLPELQRVIADAYTPLQGNPHGIMRQATMEFSRGVSSEEVRRACEQIRPGLPKPTTDGFGSLTLKMWRDRIWDSPDGGMMNRPTRISLFVEEKTLRLEVSESEEKPSVTFDLLRPAFASRFGGSQAKWVNSVRVSNYGPSNLATIYPYNTFDRSRPRLSFGVQDVMIGTEGWSFVQKYSGTPLMLQLEKQESAIATILEASGLKAKLSEPGHIARQMLDQLGGLWGTWIIADEPTIRLLNDMAGGARRRRNSVEEIHEQFDPKSQPVGVWAELVKNRNKRDHGRLELDKLTQKNVLKLGLETRCQHCLHVNWDPVDQLRYSLNCKRCLKSYPFPQGSATPTRKWAYRVTGPFSVQDFAKGAYGALLALKAISEFETNFRALNFSTAVEIEKNGQRLEADFIALHQPDSFDAQYDPAIIIGESKSFAEGDTIRPKDIYRLKEFALAFPGSYLAISVLRDDFTENEKILLKRLVSWTRKLGENGGPRNRVLLLTGRELFRDYGPLSSTWEKLGGRYAAFGNYESTRSLRSISDSSLSIHLEVPTFEEVRRQAWEKRKNKGAKEFLRLPGQWGRMLSSLGPPA